MSADGVPGAKGNPQFLGAGAPSTATDLNLISQWAADRAGEPVVNAAGLPASGNWTGRTLWAIAEKLLYVWNGAAWQIAGGPAAIGTLSSDGNAFLAYSKVQRSFDGVVSAAWQQNRTNATTYASALILGILPAGFLPTQDVFGQCATYGSGTPNTFTVSAATGIVTLSAASPAGHTAARCNISFNIA